jgi:integrase/recombinase XerC
VLQSPNRATLEGKRDYAILVVMLTMGLRRNEVATMRRGDVRVKGDGGAELRYTPKGGDEKTRPMPTVAWHAIQAYLAARGEVATDAPMFMAHDRNAIHREAQPMSGEALRQLVNRYTVRALGRVVNPHALRHTCANEAWDTTKDLRRVQGMLGHASATTTERYLHRVTDDRAALGDALAVRLGIA